MRWPYQAIVIKILEIVSRTIVSMLEVDSSQKVVLILKDRPGLCRDFQHGSPDWTQPQISPQNITAKCVKKNESSDDPGEKR